MARTHGLAATYRYGCHCERCTRAHSQDIRLRQLARKARLEADPTLAEHGKQTTYANWRCRCGACCAANTVAGQQWRARQKAG